MTTRPHMGFARMVATVLCCLAPWASGVWAQTSGASSDSVTYNLPFPHDNADPYNPTEFPGGVSLQWPSNFNYGVVYNPVTGMYEVQQTIGDTLLFRPSSMFSLDEYLDYNIEGNLSEFWNELQEEEDAADKAFAPKLEIDSELFEMIFGSNEIEIKPQGTAEITLGYTWNNTENPRIPERQRRAGAVNFDQRIQLNIGGSIGDKIELGTQFNTESLFDFENQMNIGFQGEEDDILKNIEAGNINMPLNSSLIVGSQSLFGVKLETQWGRLYNTTVFSQQKGERSEIEVEGGAQTQEFDIRADDYEANRHYFLSQYFVDQYDVAMRSLPVPNSGAMINRIEVYVVNTQANTQDVRNVVAFTDLGEHPDYVSTNLPLGSLTDNTSVFDGALLEPATEATPNRAPSNFNNDLFRSLTLDEGVMDFTGANQAISGALGGQLKQGVHYERVGNARKLSPSEFTFNSRSGVHLVAPVPQQRRGLGGRLRIHLGWGDLPGRHVEPGRVRRAWLLDFEDAQVVGHPGEAGQRRPSPAVAGDDEKRLLHGGVWREQRGLPVGRVVQRPQLRGGPQLHPT